MAFGLLKEGKPIDLIMKNDDYVKKGRKFAPSNSFFLSVSPFNCQEMDRVVF